MLLENLYPLFVLFNENEPTQSYKVMRMNVWEHPEEFELEIRESQGDEHPSRVILRRAEDHPIHVWKIGYEALHPIEKVWMPILDTSAKHYFFGSYCYSQKNGNLFEKVKLAQQMQRYYMVVYFNDLKKNTSPIPAFVAELIKKDAIAKKDSCSISMNRFEECDRLAVTSCYHLFDHPSLCMWLKRNDTCPLCNTVITSMRILSV